MTTKNFSSISLPRPKCSLQVGNMLIEPNQPNKSSWIPKFSDIIQIVEVRQTGSTQLNMLVKQMKHVIGSYIVINDVRPELFLRRDFIKKFVHSGTVHLTQATRDESDYRICSIDNQLQITLNEKQYRRFGLIGKKISNNKAKRGASHYLITCDLKDKRLINSNSYHDKLVQTFKRLGALMQVYFRFVPNISATNANMSISEATSESLYFFNYVIHEYATDGFLPVPLTGCSEVRQKIDKKWLNCSQLHPDLSLTTTGGIAEIVDWIGFQILGINCDKEEIRSRYPDEQERLDVACLQLSGMVDFKHVQEILSDIFEAQDDNVVLRAMCLYGKQPKNSNCMIMRNFSQAIIGSNGSQLLTVAKIINYR